MSLIALLARTPMVSWFAQTHHSHGGMHPPARLHYLTIQTLAVQRGNRQQKRESSTGSEMEKSFFLAQATSSGTSGKIHSYFILALRFARGDMI